tara:strand:+ start:663 stop:1328 length:666 start_codon:yes stop_codon:yes gene_type:complete
MAQNGSGCCEFMIQTNNGVGSIFTAKTPTSLLDTGTTNQKSLFTQVPVIVGAYYEDQGSSALLSCLTGSTPGMLTFGGVPPTGGGTTIALSSQNLNGEPTFFSALDAGDPTYSFKYSWTYSGGPSWVNQINLGWVGRVTTSSGIGGGTADRWRMETTCSDNSVAGSQPRCVVFFLGIQKMTGGQFDGSGAPANYGGSLNQAPFAAGVVDSALFPLSITQSN